MKVLQSTHEGTRSSVIHLPKQAINGGSQITKLATWLAIKQAKGRKIPAIHPERINDPQVLTFMQRYISSDREQANGEWLAGEVYWLYFKADIQTQGAFVEAIAQRNRLPLPSGDWTPRQRLVQALYGNDPDAIDDSDGKRDSKAGKRISAAIRRFLTKNGMRGPRKTRAEELMPRRTKVFLADLIAVASAAERKILDRLIARKYGREAVKIAA